MNHCLRLLFLLFIILPSNLLPGSPSNEAVKLKEKIFSLYAKENYELLEDAINEIDKLSLDDRIYLCVQLIDHYLGEHTGGLLREKCTKIGDKIIPFLIEKKNIRCIKRKVPEPQCLQGREGMIIKMILEAVKDGIVLYEAPPDEVLEGLEKEAKSDLRIIKVFLDDYKYRFKTLPQSLKILKVYVWEEYGYKLRIFTPWGTPYKYRVVKDSYEINYGKPPWKDEGYKR